MELLVVVVAMSWKCIARLLLAVCCGVRSEYGELDAVGDAAGAGGAAEAKAKAVVLLWLVIATSRGNPLFTSRRLLCASVRAAATAASCWVWLSSASFSSLFAFFALRCKSAKP